MLWSAPACRRCPGGHGEGETGGNSLRPRGPVTPRTKMKVPLVVICLVLALGGRVWVYLSEDSPLLSVVMTPIYEESPFLWAGKQYWTDPPQVAPGVIDRYRDIPARYPSAAACGFDPVAPPAQVPWAEPLDLQEFEVCLFRILSTLGSHAAGEAWLLRRGWQREEVHDETNLARFYNSDGPLTRYAYRMDVAEWGMPYGTAASRSWAVNQTRTVTLSVTREPERGIVEVTTGNTGFWSK